jgi:para-nitrobenzyl esterase
MTFPTSPPHDADRRLSARLMGYWVAFATFGNPNGGTRPHWAPFEAGREAVMDVSLANSTMRPAFRSAQLDWVASKLSGPSVW